MVVSLPSLPSAVEGELRNPSAGRHWSHSAAGYAWHGLEWGDAADPPMVLVHGVTSDSGTFWRVGPAISATGRFVVAIDLPGHGRTGGWQGRHRFEETAADVRALLVARGLDRPDLAVLGHSWGARIVASLPAVGMSPRPLILLDPPALTMADLDEMTRDVEEQPVAAPRDAIAMLAAAHPDWSEGDVQAKAEGLARFDQAAVGSVLLDNGDWDAGLTQLDDPAARSTDVWLIRGEPASGGLTADHLLPAFEERLGPDHVITIAGAPHSPQRTHVEATVAAILLALGATS